MAQTNRRWSYLVPLLLLAGCVPSTSSRSPLPTQATPTYSLEGLESVMGQSAARLASMFGAPDLDIREGSARKLQFASPVCVLDAYLYPRGSGDPVVTHIDARLPDGRDVDRASCVAALSRRSRREQAR